MKIEDFLKSRNKNLTESEVAGVKSRLIFAGLNENLDAQEEVIAGGILDKLIDKMRQVNKDRDDFSDKSSTLPTFDDVVMGTGDALKVSLVNGRLATFNTKSNVIMPLKKSA